MNNNKKINVMGKMDTFGANTVGIIVALGGALSAVDGENEQGGEACRHVGDACPKRALGV